MAWGYAGIFRELNKDLKWICYWIYSVDNLRKLTEKESNHRPPPFLDLPLSSQALLKKPSSTHKQGYAHRFRPFTRYSGCWVLASAVAFLAIVVVILIIVVILLATVVTGPLPGLVTQGFRRCRDLLRISIWSIEDRPIGSGLWITGINTSNKELAESPGQKWFLPSVLNVWFTRSPVEKIFYGQSDLTQSTGKTGMLHTPITIKSIRLPGLNQVSEARPVKIQRTHHDIKHLSLW